MQSRINLSLTVMLVKRIFSSVYGVCVGGVGNDQVLIVAGG
jgi:hypothetical protein